jgi:23S rRNA pseudouridine1911/1915/1917 synthase
MDEQFELKATDKSLLRLDKFISEQRKDLSRTKVQSWIKQGYVQVNNEIISDPSSKVKENDLIKLEIPPSAPTKVTSKKLTLNIVYEDEHLAILNKPAGLTVHPGAGNHSDTLVNGLLEHYKYKLSSMYGPERPGIVHRLDRNTSGLLIIAKDNETHMALTNLLRDHKISRIYNAIIWGSPEKMAGSIELNIGRNPQNRKKMSTQLVGGKRAVTHYKTLKIFQQRAASLIECELETGRTHQIRVHLTHIGYPIIGDPEYGSMRTKRVQQLSESAAEHISMIKRQMLHAKRIIFSHPITNKPIDLEIDLPEDMKTLISELSK